MEFIKKNWIWILVAVVIIVAIIYFKKKPAGTLGRGTELGRAFVPGSTGGEDAITAVKTIIKQGVSSFDDLRQKALAKGYHVISKEFAASAKMTPDPKRVIVDVVQMNCIKAPCPQGYNVVG